MQQVFVKDSKKQDAQSEESQKFSDAITFKTPHHKRNTSPLFSLLIARNNGRQTLLVFMNTYSHTYSR